MFYCSECEPKNYTLDEFEHCIKSQDFYIVECENCRKPIKVFEFENEILVSDIYNENSTINLVYNQIYEEDESQK